MADIAESICEAIQTIVDQSLSSAEFDKTIQAKIVSVTDSTIGSYRVSYQDSTFTAYAASTEATYTKGSTVYVLIPGGDFTKDKTILGAVERIGVNYVTAIEGADAYDILGTNLIIKSPSLEFSSYAEITEENDGTVVLYALDENNQPLESNLIEFDDTAMMSYITDSDTILVGFTVQTSIPTENKFSGDYGIVMGLDFQDNATGAIVTRPLTLNTEMMSGQPYNYLVTTKQQVPYAVDGANFVRISSITAFCGGFPYSDDEAAADIFLSDFTLYAADALSEEDLDSYSLSLTAPQGYVFSSEGANTGTSTTLQAKVRIKGVAIDEDSQSVDYYWFRENSSIKTTDTYYNSYGGSGWQCLNDFNIISTTSNDETLEINTVEWVAGSSTLSVAKAGILSQSLTYKCVAVYTDNDQQTILEKTIVIYNNDAMYNLSLTTNTGRTSFSNDQGNPTLICSVTDKSGNEVNLSTGTLTYTWTKTDNSGYTSSLSEDEELNAAEAEYLQSMIESYYDLLTETTLANATAATVEDINAKYKADLAKLNAQLAAYVQSYTTIVNSLTTEEYKTTLLNNLQDQVEDSIAQLQELEDAGVADTIEVSDILNRVDGNKIYNIDISSITTFAKYSCAVNIVADGAITYLGTATITISNSLSTEGSYSLIINNGTALYKYDENGVAPTSSINENPIEIPALTFTIYDNVGDAIDDAVAAQCDIQWIVPTTNTMLTFDGMGDPASIDTTAGTATYTKTTLVYGIASSYNIGYTNNDITLIVQYKDITLTRTTSITFTKQGESGTNGTDYTCKIVLNATKIPDIPIITWTSTKGGQLNWSPRNTGKWFNVQLWNNNNKIFESYEDGNANTGGSVTVTWSILGNTYSSGSEKITDSHLFSYEEDEDGGVWQLNSFDSLTSWLTTSWATTSDRQQTFSRYANIVKVQVDYTLSNDTKTFYDTLPINSTYCLNSKYTIDIPSNAGFKYATYISDGTQPKYVKDNPFEVTISQDITSNNITYTEDISTLSDDNEYSVDYNWMTAGAIYSSSSWKTNSDLTLVDTYTSQLEDYDKKIKNLIAEGTEYDEDTVKAQVVTLARNQATYKPANTYTGYQVTNAVICEITKDGTLIGFVHIPVHLMLNKFGLASLNGWDGNSVKVSEDGGYILAPQIGAGEKNSNNAFTGVVMGVVQEMGSSSKDIGLVGYASGARSIFLDASTGAATFGTASSGQIRIDPDSSGEQVIESGNYSESEKKGLRINFSEDNPSITFGSGNFSVNSKGYLTAKGGGSIAGWSISDDTLKKTSGGSYTVGLNSKYESKDTVAIWAGGSDPDQGYFRVTYGGALTSTSGSIAGWSISASYLQSNNITINSNGTIYSNSHTAYENSGQSGFYIGSKGISLGSSDQFKVSDSGALTASNATLQGSICTSGHKSYSSTADGFYLGSDGLSIGNFQVNSAGTMSGKNWSISSSGAATFKNINITNNSGTSSSSLNWTDSSGNTVFGVTSDGTLTAKNANISGSVSMSGNITATGGSIGGCTINTDGISGTGWSIGSNGTVSLASGKFVASPIQISISGNLYSSGTSYRWDNTCVVDATATKISVNGFTSDQTADLAIDNKGRDGAILIPIYSTKYGIRLNFKNGIFITAQLVTMADTDNSAGKTFYLGDPSCLIALSN